MNPEPARNPTAIIALGNPLMSDEGIGVCVLQALLERADVPPGIDLIDLGTGGFQVLHELAGRTKVVFIDCAFMDEEPGTIRRFTPDEVKSSKVQTRLSLHEGDLLQTIALSRRLGECPDDIVIFGIQPASVEPGEHLTPELAERLNEYVEDILKEL